ncbi:molybdopterin-dependent oxidoreductase [Psychromicrobium lacuslunae]|uniref:Oxidoreductase n=1 Tax=Psychromicrobium lacuslunae TaxID=1618207 RepID=A0A0D4BZ41_9MICC|nr:molybdopterin-dependent oxidoreductase [Psychromicrobium lacuslunae]AJT41707.1 oxidoreductase [Psychromicrobium lacuslunae]
MKHGGWFKRALSGLVAALLALGIAELLALLIPGLSSPVTVVGAFVVDIVPPWAKDFAIDTFGTNDKLALTVGLVGVILLVALLAGLLERVKLPLGSALIAIFGVVGAVAAVTRANASGWTVLPSLLGAAAGILVLRLLIRKLSGAKLPLELLDRRSFLQLAGLATVLGLAAGAVGRTVKQVSSAVTNFVLPTPKTRESIPAGADLKIPGLSPFVTPNADFYRIDTALQVPQIDTASWQLRIFGMVDREVTMSFAELLEQPMIERVLSLTCVSNQVGGKLAGNAVWIGTPIRDLLARAGVSQDADMVLSSSQDGYTASTPLDALTDPGRDALLAVGMNGTPLPPEHGYPVRMVVPGLYGYVSATKWLVSLEVTRFDRKQAYWTPRGYAEKAPIKLASRIEVPGPFAKLDKGSVVVAGTAWAQHTGVASVEVKIDDGAWQKADLGEVPSKDTWRQWRFNWQAQESGNHYIYVRATDAQGRVQESTNHYPLPDGATGFHNIAVSVN